MAKIIYENDDGKKLISEIPANLIKEDALNEIWTAMRKEIRELEGF